MTPPQLRATAARIWKSKDWLLLRSFFHDPSDRVEKCLLWCKLFLPDIFRDGSPEFHRGLVERLLSDKNEYIAAPRGHAKTSVTQGVMCFIAANQIKKFVVIIEKSYGTATEVLSVVREAWQDNARILSVYGKRVSVDSSGMTVGSAKDTQADVLINGVRFRAIGFETPIRGIKAGAFRPDLILLDDIETDEAVRSEEQRVKYMENYTRGVLPAPDINGSVKMIGTILHQDSLLNKLIVAHDGWLLKAYDPSASDPRLTLLWPERWTWEKLQQKKADMEAEGLGSSAFSQEFLNEAIDASRRSFPDKWLERRFKEDDIKFKAINWFCCIDAASRISRKSDFTGVSVVGIDGDNNWYIKYAKRYKVDIKGLVDLVFSIQSRFEVQTIGVEKVAMEDQLMPLLKEQMEQRRIWPNVVELKHMGRAKEARILGALQGRFESGKIWFMDGSHDDQGLLRGELRDFPMGKNDDILDSLAYVSDIGSRPFSRDSSQSTTLAERLREKRRGMRKSVLRMLS